MKYKEKMRQVGLNISYYRRFRDMTQMELAERVHISSCYMSQIERGLVKNAASLPVLIAIADELHVEVAELFKFRELPSKKE